MGAGRVCWVGRGFRGFGRGYQVRLLGRLELLMPSGARRRLFIAPEWYPQSSLGRGRWCWYPRNRPRTDNPTSSLAGSLFRPPVSKGQSLRRITNQEIPLESRNPPRASVACLWSPACSSAAAVVLAQPRQTPVELCRVQLVVVLRKESVGTDEELVGVSQQRQHRNIPSTLKRREPPHQSTMHPPNIYT